MSAFQPGETYRLAGKIKWFNRSKGFGFIIPNDGSGDVFLPLSALERSGHSEAPDGASIVPVDVIRGGADVTWPPGTAALCLSRP